MLRLSFFKPLILAAAMIVLATPDVLAANKGLAQRFDWVSVWGGIFPDRGIPSGQFGPKQDIRNAIENCGIGDPDYGKVGAYGVDFNGDGHADIVTEARGYFAQGYNRMTCPFAICTEARGCNISLYVQGGISQAMSRPPQSNPYEQTASGAPSQATQMQSTGSGTTGGSPYYQPCPEDPAENRSCRRDCPATTQNCPHLFTYNTALAWDGLVFDWSFISANQFNSNVKERALRTDGSSKYYGAFNDNPVFVLQRLSGHCTLEEMDANNNNVVEANEKCIKYLQFSRGRFTDLYAPDAYVGVDEQDERVTTTLFNCRTARIKQGAPAQPTSCSNAGATYDSDWRAQDNGLKLASKTSQAAGTMAYQIANFSDPGHEEGLARFICKEVTNTSGRDLLVPQRTDVELSSFNKAAEAGLIPGVKVTDCTKRFTAWSGQTTCPPLSCGETRQITANRNCQRSSSAFATCIECAKIKDPQVIRGFENKCQFSAICMGPACSDSGGGGDCLAAGAGVLMADGSTKPIEKIVVGDKVLGFDKNAPLAAPKVATVKGLLVSDRMAMVSINGTKVSPNHVVTVEAGRLTRAAKIQPGMQLVGTSGQAVPVLSAFMAGEEKSYNLDLDGADGFIADGLRVMMHPIGE